MKVYTLAIVAAALAVPGTAFAEDFSIEYTWGEVQMTGGIGPQGTVARAGTLDGTFVVTNADGSTVNGTAHCIGMDDDGSPFELRMSCDTATSNSTAAMGLLCIWRGPQGPGTPLSCVGFLTGKSGQLQGRGGMVTINWYDSGKAHGAGQWWPRQVQ